MTQDSIDMVERYGFEPVFVNVFFLQDILVGRKPLVKKVATNHPLPTNRESVGQIQCWQLSTDGSIIVGSFLGSF